MDRDLQERPRGGHLADAVAGADAGGDRRGDDEDSGGGCAGAEEGEAGDYCLSAAFALWVGGGSSFLDGVEFEGGLLEGLDG